VRLAVVKVGRNVKQVCPFKCQLYSSVVNVKDSSAAIQERNTQGKGVPCMHRTRQEISQIKWVNDVLFGEMVLPSLVPDRGERGEIEILFGAISGACTTSRSRARNLRNGLHVRRPRRWGTIVFAIWATKLPLLPRKVVQPVAHCKRPERSLRLSSRRMAARLCQFYSSRGHVLKPSGQSKYAFFFFLESLTKLCTLSLMTLKLSASWANVGGVPIIIVDGEANSQANQDRH
jgi:hypothetical protein